MKIYFSGAGGRESVPECVLGPRGHLMPTFADYYRSGPTARFRRFIRTKQSQVFLDSGAFGLFQSYGSALATYFRSRTGFDYLDRYARFVKRYARGIDVYANVDVIGDPELTWRNQRYFEECHQLRPVPVVHCGESLKWLRRYVQKGHQRIGLGGLVDNNKSKIQIQEWLDDCFDYLVLSNGTTRAKIHGFGVTNTAWLLRYPFHSTDSASWCKFAAYGNIVVPRRKAGDFRFDVPPRMVKTSLHDLEDLSPARRASLESWLREIQIPFGGPQKPGVSNSANFRRIANLHYFDRLAALIRRPLSVAATASQPVLSRVGF